MDETSDEVYDYDKCLFFRLLQTVKFRVKFEFIQQQQGLVVCPIKLAQFNRENLKEIANLIDSHLFVPSPFYKHHYVPLVSLIALASLNSSSVLSSSLPLDHSQQIHLILNDSNDFNNNNNNSNSNELYLMNLRRRICRHVKLLNIQTAFTDNFKQYKILIVNKQLCYKQINNLLSFKTSSAIEKRLAQIDSENELEEFDEDTKTTDAVNQDSDSEIYSERIVANNMVTYVTNESPFGNFSSLNDVKTYRQSIDFMQENLLSLSLNNWNSGSLVSSSSSSTNSDNEEYDTLKKRTLIGADLLSELELFRKTYIILYTHLEDCAEQLIKLFTKYLYKFSKAIKHKRIQSNDNLDLMILISCENAIVGYLYSRIWPCILQLNYDQDSETELKCKQLINYLKLNSTKLNEDSSNLCSRFFNIDSKYFRLNTQPVLNELKRLGLLNIPFEKLECLKSSIDLLTNELTILLTGLKEQCIITSDLLIPLVAFILIRANLNCLHSIIYFIDKFQLSTKQTVKSVSSNKLDELAYFMTTFKAAVQFIETSQIH